MLIFIGVVIIWFTVLNKGTAIITTELTNYSITIRGKITLCEVDPCSIELPKGTYQIIFEKEGYNKNTTNITIKRGTKTPVVLMPKKIIKLKLKKSNTTEKRNPKIQFPSDINPNNIISSVWNKERDSFLYLDSSDSRLKITKNGEESLITSLKNISPPFDLYLSDDSSKIIGNQGQDLYFIETKEGKRKKIVLNFTPSAITIAPTGDYILLNTDSELNLINWNDTNQLNNLQTSLNLNNSVWINSDELVTYEINKNNNKTIIWSFYPKTKTRINLTEKFHFPVSEIKYDQEVNKISIFNSEEKKWYEVIQ